MKRNILVYEPCISNVPYLVFVLNMAQMGCTHARTAEEALNWIEAATLKVISFDLVVISSVGAGVLEDEFLQKLSEFPIEVLVLQRETVTSPVLERSLECHPDQLLDWLNNFRGDKGAGSESTTNSVDISCSTQPTRGTG